MAVHVTYGDKKTKRRYMKMSEKDSKEDLIGFGQHLGSRDSVVLKNDGIAQSTVSSKLSDSPSPRPGYKYGIPRPKLQQLPPISPTSPREMLPFVKEDYYTDTVLVVEGKILYIQGSLLGYASPYFQELLQNVHRSSGYSRGKVEVKITDKSYQDIVDLLSFIHPGVCKDLTEKSAVRLLPIVDEYGMHAVKRRCEVVLLKYLKKNAHLMINKIPKGPTIHKNRLDNAPEILLKCTRAADKGHSDILMDQCLKIFSNPEISLRDLKSSVELSDQVKARIYETRMDTTSSKLNKIYGELEKEKQENDVLKSQLSYRYQGNKPGVRNHRLTRSDDDVSDEKQTTPTTLPFYLTKHYQRHKRKKVDQNKEAGQAQKATVPDVSTKNGPG